MHESQNKHLQRHHFVAEYSAVIEIQHTCAALKSVVVAKDFFSAELKIKVENNDESRHRCKVAYFWSSLNAQS